MQSNTIFFTGRYPKTFSAGSTFFLLGKKENNTANNTPFEGQHLDTILTTDPEHKFQVAAKALNIGGIILDADITQSPILTANFDSLEDEFTQEYGLFPVTLSLDEKVMFLNFLDKKGFNSKRDEVLIYNRLGIGKDIIFDMNEQNIFNLPNMLKHCSVGQLNPSKTHLIYVFSQAHIQLQKKEKILDIKNMTFSHIDGTNTSLESIYTILQNFSENMDGDIFIVASELHIENSNENTSTAKEQISAAPLVLRIKFATQPLISQESLFTAIAEQLPLLSA